MKKVSMKSTLLPVAACIGLSAYAMPSDVTARALPAFAGAARFGSDASCFLEGNGGPIQKYCAGSPQWVLPLITDHASTHTVYVAARGAKSGVNNVSCRPYSVTKEGTLSVGTEAVTVLNNGATESLKLSVFVPSYGAAWVTCYMAPDTRIFSVNYTW